jgi:hypothetical protein
MARTIGLHPHSQYEFRTNASYRKEWNWLPDQQRSDIIATQLTYLDFHGWLKENLKHSAESNPTLHQWNELVFDIDEGFHRTDILLFASICEAALHAVLYHYYQRDAVNAHNALKRCYEKREEVFLALNVSEFEMVGASTPTSGTLGLRKTNVTPLSDSEIKFVNLIRAGEEIGVFGNSLRLRLDALRDDRNTIHLAQHLRIQNKDGKFTRTDRDAAKLVTEDLRVALSAYMSSNP